MSKECFLNIFANNLCEDEFITLIIEKMKEQSSFYIVFVNVDVLVKAEQNSYLKKIINCAEFTMLDGMPLIWVSKLYKNSFKQKISGSDIVPKICEKAMQYGWNVFLLGGASGIPELAAHNLKIKYPNLRIVGTYSPPMNFEKDTEEIKRINEKIKTSKADIVIVCFGCPKQEIFVYKNYKESGAKMYICAGGTVDFLSGKIRRCPHWVSKIGFEWFFRFLMEPKRMFKRYFIDDMKIISIIWKYRWQRRK